MQYTQKLHLLFILVCFVSDLLEGGEEKKKRLRYMALKLRCIYFINFTIITLVEGISTFRLACQIGAKLIQQIERDFHHFHAVTMINSFHSACVCVCVRVRVRVLVHCDLPTTNCVMRRYLQLQTTHHPDLHSNEWKNFDTGDNTHTHTI